MTTKTEQQNAMIKFAEDVTKKGSIIIDDNEYEVVKNSRYTVWLKGKKGAEYTISCMPKMSVMEADFPVFQMLDGRSRTKGYYAFDGNKGIKLYL